MDRSVSGCSGFMLAMVLVADRYSHCAISTAPGATDKPRYRTGQWGHTCGAGHPHAGQSLVLSTVVSWLAMLSVILHSTGL